MTHLETKQKIIDIQQGNPEDAIKEFIKEIITEGRIWTIFNEGLVVIDDEDEESHIPIWSSIEQAELNIDDAFADYEPVSVDLMGFISGLLPDLIQDDISVMLWYFNDRGLPMNSVELMLNLDIMMSDMDIPSKEFKEMKSGGYDFDEMLFQMRMNLAGGKDDAEYPRKPVWLDSGDPWSKFFHNQKELFDKGSVVYAAVVQSNIGNYDIDVDVDLPIDLIYSTDKDLNHNPVALQRMSNIIFSYKNTDVTPDDLKETTNLLFNDETGPITHKLPHSFTDGKDVYLTKTIAQKDNLPGNVLMGSLLPLIADPENLNFATILPKEYWDSRMISHYILDENHGDSDEEESEIMRKELARVKKLNEDDQYDYFLKRLIEEEHIWFQQTSPNRQINENRDIRKNQKVDEDGKELLALWPTADFFIQCSTSKADSGDMTLYRFLIEKIEEMKKKNINAAILADGDSWVEKTPEELYSDINKLIIDNE